MRFSQKETNSQGTEPRRHPHLGLSGPECWRSTPVQTGEWEESRGDGQFGYPNSGITNLHCEETIKMSLEELEQQQV